MACDTLFRDTCETTEPCPWKKRIRGCVRMINAHVEDLYERVRDRRKR